MRLDRWDTPIKSRRQRRRHHDGRYRNFGTTESRLFPNQTNKNFQNGLKLKWVSSSDESIPAYLAKNPIFFTFVLLIGLKAYVFQTRTRQVNHDAPSWIIQSLNGYTVLMLP